MKSRVVWGSPGTGKTTYLLEVCKTYVAAGARVCLVSHTRAAAQELSSRIKALKLSGTLAASTLHSLVFNKLRLSRNRIVTTERLVEFGKQAGVKISGEFDITGEQERHIEEGDEAMAIINKAAASMCLPIDEYLRSQRMLPRSTFEYIATNYDAYKESLGLMDFNDILVEFVRSPEPLDYDVLVVDEGQDMSALQWAVVDELVKGVKWAVVAGDPDQALYVWGGAKVGGLRDFAEKYQSDQHVLPQSYRIPKRVHDVAMAVRSHIRDKDDVQYRPRDVLGTVNKLAAAYNLGFDSRDTLVLYRTHALRREIEQVLLDECIPYTTINGLKDPWGGRFGRAVNVYKAIQNGEDVSAAALRSLSQLCSVNMITKARPWHRYMNIPNRLLRYMVETEGELPSIRLSTIHGAKGREADRVILYTGQTQRVIDGMAYDADSEHRVFYVGVTRAKETLDIVEGENSYEGI